MLWSCLSGRSVTGFPNISGPLIPGSDCGLDMLHEGSHRSVNARGRLVICVLLAFAAIGYLWVQGGFSFEAVAAQESDLRTYQQAHPRFFYGAAFLFYVGVTGLSLPGAWLLTLVFGWLFGFLPGLILVSFASTGGASLAFLLSRHLLTRIIKPLYGHSLQVVRESLARDGAFYLFTLRLIPAMPYVGINLVMGLTPIKLVTFWWVSQLGMLPATIVYVSAGSTVPDLHALGDQGVSGIISPQLLVAFAVLGLFPLLARLAMRRLGWGSATARR